MMMMSEGRKVTNSLAPSGGEKGGASSSDVQPKKRWRTGKELKLSREEEVKRKIAAEEEKRNRAEEERLAKLSEHLDAKKRKCGTSTVAERQQNITNEPLDASEATSSSGQEKAPLPRGEVMLQLRRYGLPATLFGESDLERFRRLMTHRLDSANDNEDLLTGQIHALREAEQDREGDEDEDEVEEADAFFRSNRSASNIEAQGRDAGLGDGAGGSSSISRQERYKGLLDSAPSAEDVAKPGYKETYVRCFLRYMLREWQSEIDAMNEEKRKSSDGKMAVTLHRDTRRNLRPLLRLLQKREAEQEVLDKVYAIARLCQSRDFKKAHDMYIALAIGNAAWPMGVTMVGIHSRAAQGKILSSQVAHILNDETTRKYIQMIKRLMSFAQRKFPSDPSREVKLATRTV